MPLNVIRSLTMAPEMDSNFIENMLLRCITPSNLRTTYPRPQAPSDLVYVDSERPSDLGVKFARLENETTAMQTVNLFTTDDLPLNFQNWPGGHAPVLP